MRDNVPDRDERLIAAAQAAASWARARRASWTTAPLPLAAPGGTAPIATPKAEVHAAPAPASVPAHVVPPPGHVTPHPVQAHDPLHPVSSRAIDHHDAVFIDPTDQSTGAPVVRWLVRAAVVAALSAGVYVGVPYLLNALPAWTASSPVAAPTKNDPAAGGGKPTAGLRVSSSPAGAQVLVDGKLRGVTPLTLANLTIGRHEVALKSETGTVRRIVTLAAGETATVDESIFSGFVVVYSPFEVTIVESGRVLRPDERNQVMLAPGIHELRLSNKALAYEAVLQVDVKPGEATPVRLTPAPSTLTVTAPGAADVWLDGARVGETPLHALSVPLGTHEVVVKRASGGERRFTVTIGVKPFTLNAEF